ncbi:UAA transporter [Trametes coccinea BRFM310]|uniref:UAA transporter n=1 Tax=Trametes coccinea (strain BRFM310) TaxID=1353009 RepID=A0A1Y2IKW1_TRAC3|nr:UAA transporter [Trametes coccinea BRFM310]
MSASDIARGLTLGVVSDWATTLGLIFGGCCSNALSLEHLTRSYPRSGSLITFAQFALISLHGLPKFLVLAPLAPSPLASSPSTPSSRARWWRRVPLPQLRARRTPLAPYLAQVALFYAVSLLNNAAFAYAIPMPVHIIFRSGGLVVSMLMGWAVAGKRYNTVQVLSVLLVTAGVVLTTLSASTPKRDKSPMSSAASSSEPQADGGWLSQEQWRYATGIALLTLALVLSGLLGIVQDWTYARYVRGKRAPGPSTAVDKAVPARAQTNGHTNGHSNGHSNGNPEKTSSANPAAPAVGAEAEPWQESMFYLHFLSLPMFYFVRHDLAAQAHALRASPPLHLAIPASLSAPLQRALTLYPPIGLSEPLLGHRTKRHPQPHPHPHPIALDLDLRLALPSAYAALALTALTAMACAAGVHRMTARGVSALTVTLLLVVRKAASLVLSVVLFGARGGAVSRGVWAGAGMVFVGTLGYAAGSRRGAGKEKGQKEKRE